MDSASLLGAILGFVCFDVLRLYRWEAKKFFEEGEKIDLPRLLQHEIVVLVTAVVVGLVIGSVIMGWPNGLWVGFSAPTSLMAFLNPSRGGVLEDQAEPSTPSVSTRAKEFVRTHYGMY